jgi:hypothetical protein
LKKLLYLSCHSILEYDELKLFNELGVNVFSPGAYVEPANPGDASLRPGIPGLVYDPADVAAFHALGAPGVDNKERLTKEFVDRFDAVMVMHIPKWIQVNWEAMKHKTVIWRTIGQCLSHQEVAMKPYRDQGLRVVRYSPKERTIPGFCGEDAMIRFSKDPADFHSWNGNEKAVITFAQSMPARGQACNYHLFEAVTRAYPRKLFGPGNEAAGTMNQGKVPYDTLQKAMRDHRVYFYTGTHPASYTLNFMEAWMTGIPIVAIGPSNGNASYFPGHKLYEVDSLIENGVTGFVSDDFTELRKNIDQLMNDDKLAATISANARKRALEVFSKDKIKDQWTNFFTGLNLLN